MILTSATFAQLLDIAPSCLHLMLADGSEVPREAIRSAKWSGGCNAGEDITLGSTVATHLEAEIDRTRLGGLDLTDSMLAVTLTLDGAEDEITCGVLQVEKVDGDDDILTITANDAMVYAFDQRYALDDEALGFDWEAGVAGMTLLDAICDELGITLATTDLPPILLQYQDCSGLTYREVLAFLACMWGKFARIDGTGQLVLGWYTAADRSIGPGRYYDGELKKADTDYTVEYIKCYSDHLAETLLCGDVQGARGISISCPWMTQEQLQVVWESIFRFTYRPVSSLRFLGDPRLEPGDVIQVTDRAGATYTVPVMSISHEFDGGLITEIAAAGKSAASSSGASGDDKLGPVTRMIERAEQALKVTLIKYQDRIQSMVQSLDGSVSEITQKVDNITLKVEQKVGSDGTVYAEISIGIGHNSLSGFIQMTGNLQVDGQLSADALYAAMGSIADLTVNRLRTDDHIKRYLAGDMSDADYICIEGDALEFRGAQTDGSRVQAKNPSGLAVYWEADVETATLAADGWPYIDGKRVFTTTTVTDWPVYVYNYNETVKRSTHFEDVDGAPGVVDTFGVGDGAGGNIGWIVKSVEGLRMIFRTSNKKDLGVVMNNNGFMDLYGVRRTTLLDLSEVPFGKLYEMVEGIDTEFSWTIERDDKGRPVRVIDDVDGHVEQVRWWG